MIQYKRPNVTLSCLHNKRRSGTSSEEHRQILDQNPNARLEFEECWGKEQVHGALHAMQGFVCAYCQRKTDPRDPHHVDHFRPKRGGYFWLAYEWDNFFWSCSLCNEIKGDVFPLSAGSTKTTFENRNAVHLEERLLIDAVQDPVDEWLAVVLDDESESKLGDVIPRKEDRSNLGWKRADETIRFFQLNTDTAHKRERALLIAELTKLHRAQKWDELSRRASRFLPQSLTVRCFLKVFAPEHLPAPHVELKWFVEDLCTLLMNYCQSRESNEYESASLERRRQILRWTLAVLWKDPPAASPSDVEAWLEAANCKGFVNGFYKKLCRAESHQDGALDEAETGE